jgi:hypothetical protein
MPAKNLSNVRLAYSIPRLAKLSDLSRSLIYEEINAGRLVARKAGRRTIVRRSDAFRWLRSLPTVGALSNPTPETGDVPRLIG